MQWAWSEWMAFQKINITIINKKNAVTQRAHSQASNAKISQRSPDEKKNTTTTKDAIPSRGEKSLLGLVLRSRKKRQWQTQRIKKEIRHIQLFLYTANVLLFIPGRRSCWPLRKKTASQYKRWCDDDGKKKTPLDPYHFLRLLFLPFRILIGYRNLNVNRASSQPYLGHHCFFFFHFLFFIPTSPHLRGQSFLTNIDNYLQST